MRNRIYYIFIYIIFYYTLPFNIITYSQNFNQLQKLVASDLFTYDNFGSSVAIYGKLAIVGSPLEDQDSEGNNWISASGSAYIYECDSYGNWNEIQKISPSTRNTNNKFGSSVACSKNNIIVSSYLEDIDGVEDCGAVYIFSKDQDGIWQEKQKLTASDKNTHEQFGYSVSIFENYLAIGAYNGSANGINKAGAVYIYKLGDDETWSETQKITASDYDTEDFFGYSVSMDMNHIIVGAEGADDDQNGTNYINYAGAAYIFDLDAATGNWIQTQKLVSSDRQAIDCFGHSVSISGNYAVIGAYKEDENSSESNTLDESGSAYIFKRDNSNNWTQIQKIVASDRSEQDHFGVSVSICNNYAIVGANYEDEDIAETNPTTESGSAYCFKLNESGTWDQFQKIKASDNEESDVFGSSVSISGNNIFIGAFLEDPVSGGYSLSEAGSAYIFNLTNSYVINSTCNSGGIIEPYGYYTLMDNEAVTYNITPEDNYEISNISVNNSSITPNQSFTLSNLTSDQTVEVLFGLASSVEDPSAINNINIFPNPAKNQITIASHTLSTHKNKLAYIINIHGQIAKTIQLNNCNSITISVSELQPGTYFFKIENHKVLKFTKI